LVLVGRTPSHRWGCPRPEPPPEDSTGPPSAASKGRREGERGHHGRNTWRRRLRAQPARSDQCRAKSGDPRPPMPAE
jgi:hypothetical protein